MSAQTLHVKVQYPSESIFTYIFAFVLLIGLSVGVFASGLIKKTYPYYVKETLNGTITCEEFKTFYKDLRKLEKRKEKKDGDLIVKGSEKIHDFLEYLKNRDKEDDEKVKFDERLEEYYHTYNVPENHKEMTVEDVLDVMCTPVSEPDEDDAP